MTSTVENAFAYNVLMPDLLLFVAGMTSVFGLLVLLF